MKKAPQHKPEGQNNQDIIPQRLNQINREIQLRDLASAIITIGLVLASTLAFITIWRWFYE
jgi:hypothetical protein